MKETCFQNMILKLQKFWADYGCAMLQPIDLEVGAGTLHHFTILRAIEKKPWNAVYVQPCRRPADSRYAKNPNRVGFYYQMQVILKPSPKDIQDLYLESLRVIGINTKENDIRFVEDNWENPSVGASGLGWEVWYNGMEISQFTYMQQVGGIECEMIPGEITYGLERIAMHLQGVESFWELNWNGEEGDKKITYGDVFEQHEYQQSAYILENTNVDILFRNFKEQEDMSEKLIKQKLYIPAYEQALKASHILNLLDARGVISATERAVYINRVRGLVMKCCELVKSTEVKA
ncbi:glycine--tRNA ligase subunit alpha [Pseudomonadota bacterium]